MRAALIAALLVTGAAFAQSASVPVSVLARGQTDPLPSPSTGRGDAAVWLHPTDLTRSLILGVDGASGLVAYDLDGTQVTSVPGAFSSVDVRYGFSLSGVPYGLVAAGTLSPPVLRFFIVNPTTRALEDVTGVAVATPAGAVSCVALYHLPGDSAYALLSFSDTVVEWFRLTDDGTGRVAAQTLQPPQGLPGVPVTGCAVDEQAHATFLTVQTLGVVRGDLHPDGGFSFVTLDTTGTAELGSAVAGAGVMGSQLLVGAPGAPGGGETHFVLYDLNNGTPFSSFEVLKDGGLGSAVPVQASEGLAAVDFGVGSRFPGGLVVVHDGTNGGAHPNFKLVSWSDVALATPGVSAVPGPDPRLEGPGVMPGADGGASSGGGGHVTPGGGGSSPLDSRGRPCRCDAGGSVPLLSGWLLAGLCARRRS